MSDTPDAATIVVTGAGSGVGRATAVKFAQAGWRVALVGRGEEKLGETARLAGGDCAVFACDVGNETAVQTMAAAVIERFGTVTALVQSAATNTAPRDWAQVSSEAYHAVMAANLHGPFYVVRALLPTLRETRGTIVHINSEAGLAASEKAGVPYVASKFGLAGLTQSINAEERRNGVRAVSIFPGDINTPLLDKRPVPPPMDARAQMLQPEDLADSVWYAVNLPNRALAEEIVIRPTQN